MLNSEEFPQNHDSELINEINQLSLPEEKKKSLLTIFRQSSSFSGPVPHPSILKEYKKIVPDAPERIFQWVEKETNHRIEKEKFRQKSELRGQLFGFIFGIFLTIAAIYCLSEDHETTANIIFGSLITSVIGIFVITRFSHKSDKN